jgi:hypothetical protein
MNSMSKVKALAFKWVKNYLIQEQVPQFWLCMVIILTFDLHLRKSMLMLSVLALLVAAITKYNVLFLIPFYPTEEYLLIAIVTLAASLLSCNRKWKLYMHIFNISVVAFECPDIKYGVVATSSIFMLGMIFKHLDFETSQENKQAFQFFFGIAVTSSLLAFESWIGFEGNAALRLGVFLVASVAGRLIIARRV